MVATWVRDACDHSPMLCGCLRAYSLTALGARRSELPSRRTGLTALPRILSIAILDLLLLVVLRFARIVRQVVALGLQLLDGGQQLRHRCADVRQLDDVGVRLLRELTEPTEVVGHPLLFGQPVGELRQDARRDRDVAGFDVDPGRIGERPDDRQKGVRRQQRRLVGQRVDDRRLVVAHMSLPASVSAISIASNTNLRVPTHRDICPMPCGRIRHRICLMIAWWHR